jgi:hypothetical protein
VSVLEMVFLEAAEEVDCHDDDEEEEGEGERVLLWFSGFFVFFCAAGKGLAISSPVPGMRRSLRAEMRAVLFSRGCEEEEGEGEEAIVAVVVVVVEVEVEVERD